jgi:hypothetical protein
VIRRPSALFLFCVVFCVAGLPVCHGPARPHLYCWCGCSVCRGSDGWLTLEEIHNRNVCEACATLRDDAGHIAFHWCERLRVQREHNEQQPQSRLSSHAPHRTHLTLTRSASHRLLPLHPHTSHVRVQLQLLFLVGSLASRVCTSLQQRNARWLPRHLLAAQQDERG